jgi:signal transduction histidine kinase
MDELVHAWIVTAVVAVVVGHTLLVSRRAGTAPDLRWALATVPWLGLLFVDYAAQQGQLGALARAASCLAYQWLILGASLCLLLSLGRWPRRRLALALCAAQLVAGLATGSGALGGYGAWVGLNVLCSSLLVLLLAQAAWSRPGAPGWMVLLMAIFGLGVVLTDVDLADDGPLGVSVLHGFWAVGMWVLRLARTRRVAASAPGTPPAAETERQRLAQDLHDGVGSQLASIISALDMGTPQQRATAASLQQCLVELKLLVDGADADASALSLLASLRYRMQPLLEAAGIRLRWQVADPAVLEAVQGDAARQLLRIAQEALANALRHSGARQITLTCCHVKSRNSVLLEIEDDGVGLPPHGRAIGADSAPAGRAPLGKGVRGMHRRARGLGARLVIDAAPGRGTRVRLLAPMARLRAGPPAYGHARLA